jgi:hypothetical protein
MRFHLIVLHKQTNKSKQYNNFVILKYKNTILILINVSTNVFTYPSKYQSQVGILS